MNCGAKETSAYQFCDKENNEQEEKKVKPTDGGGLAKIAEMEANKKCTYFLNDISKATGSFIAWQGKRQNLAQNKRQYH